MREVIGCKVALGLDAPFVVTRRGAERGVYAVVWRERPSRLRQKEKHGKGD